MKLATDRQQAGLSRRQVLAYLAGSVIGLGAGYGLWHYVHQVAPQRLSLETVRLRLRGLPDALEGLSIVQLSDLHLYPYTQPEDVQRAVEMANALKPDLLCLTGDYVLSDINAVFELVPLLSALEARLGRFAVYGNHDLWFPRNREIMRLAFQQMGIPLLENQGMSLQVGQAQLYIAGLDDAWSGQPDLAQALAARTQAMPTLLLAHEPDIADQVVRQAQVDLQLSGHSHGGQVRLPFIGAPLLPYLGKKYDMGLYQLGQMQLYTNRGIGLVGAQPWSNVRFNCPPEVTHIVLSSA